MPITDSRELLKNSGLPESALIVVGTEHRLADPDSLEAMWSAIAAVVFRPKRGQGGQLLQFLRHIVIVRPVS